MVLEDLLNCGFYHRGPTAISALPAQNFIPGPHLINPPQRQVGHEHRGLARIARVWTHGAFVAVHHLDGEPLREQKLPVNLAGILIPQRRGRGSAGIVAHRQHDVIVSKLLFEDDTRHVFLVQALHDHDDSRCLGVVQAGWHRLQKPRIGAVAHGI